MPYWYVQKNKEEKDDLVFCDMKYNKIIGAQFTDDEKLLTLTI